MEKTMNKKMLLHIITAVTFAAFILLGLASASTQKVKAVEAVELYSADTLKDYLNNQPENSSDKPITVSVPANALTLKDIVDVINSSGKYVSLILSGKELTAFPADIFTNCANLTSITIPDSVTSINDNAFTGCTNLTNINLGINIASVSYKAFNNCPNLISIDVNDRNKNYTSGLYGQENGIPRRPLYNKDRTILIRCPEGYKGLFNIADSVRFIAPYCFYQTGITSIDIFQDIGPYAFYGSSITNVTLGGGGLNFSTGKVEVRKISEGAFINCPNLTSVKFDGLIELEKGSFDGNLFELWDKATTISFQNGSKGRNVTFKGTFTRPNGTSMTWARR